MRTTRHLLAAIVPAAALVCGGSRPARACHLPFNTPNGEADIVHFALNPFPDPCYTTVGPGGSVAAEFTDASSEESMWIYEVEIRNPDPSLTIGIAVRIEFPNGGGPVEGLLDFNGASSVAFYIRVQDNPPEGGVWQFTATNTTIGRTFDFDAAVIEYLFPIVGSPGDYTWEATTGDAGFTPGSFFPFLFAEISVVGPLPGDIDGDGQVGIADFLGLLAAWGPCGQPCPPSCPADLDGDCDVGISDFLMLLANWTS